ncbi:hypothetical protein CPT_Mangalyan_082 [Escherichia phage Mangalyan]|nr:hypothetical protein CPT_Mangalyan_082 [Escherichia phage Mangalyan]
MHTITEVHTCRSVNMCGSEAIAQAKGRALMWTTDESLPAP